MEDINKTTQEQVNVKEFVRIDAGLLTRENANYLYEVGVVDEEGHILYRPINNSGFDRPVQLWSLFYLIKNDIAEVTGLKDLNAIVDVMREGLYEENKKYPKVTNFIQKGTQLAIMAISRKKGGSRSKKDDFNFDD
jgi:hypothetical protein